MTRICSTLFLLSFAVVAGCGGRAKPSGLAFPESQYIKSSARAAAVMDFNEMLVANMSDGLTLAQMRSTMDGALSEIGLTMADVERVVIVFPVDPTQFKSASQTPWLAIGKVNSSVSYKKLLQRLRVDPAKRHMGKTYYVDPAQGVGQYFDEGDRLLVIAPEPQMKEALGGGPASPLAKKLEANMDRSMYATANLTQARDNLAMAAGALRPFGPVLQGSLKKLKTVSVTANVNGTNLFEFDLESDDKASAESLKTSLQSLVGMVKGLAAINAANPRAQGADKERNAIMKELIDAAKIEQSDSNVRMVLPAPKDFLSRAKAIQAAPPSRPKQPFQP